MKSSPVNYWLIGKEIFRSLRIKFHGARLKAYDKVYQNLPFTDIEKKYEGRAANFQLASWRTVSFERGELYAFYETIDGKLKKRITIELPRRVFLANDGHVFSNKGIIYNTYYNCTVLETVEEWGNDVNDSTEFIKITKTPSRSLEGLTISILSIGAVYNYAHFMFDSITKLTLIENLPKEIDWILVSGPQLPWKDKILDYLDLTKKVIWVNGYEEVQCDQLLFTSRINFSRHCSPFALNTIRKMFLSQNLLKGIPHRVIFASRKNAKDRRNNLEDLFHQFLPPFFEIIDFELLSMEETIRVCQECKYFSGVHGAAFANIVFCNPGIKVAEFQIEEILPEGHRNYYKGICDHLSFDHQVFILNEKMGESEMENLINQIVSTLQM